MIKECVKALIQLEGCELEPYICAGGKKTIGIGHVLLPNESYKKITRLQAEDLLIHDVLKIQRAIDRLIKIPLKKCQRIALTLFIFNVGAAAFQRSTLRQKINAEEHDFVREEFLKWVYASGKKQVGLVKRRHFEADIYEGRRKI